MNCNCVAEYQDRMAKECAKDAPECKNIGVEVDGLKLVCSRTSLEKRIVMTASVKYQYEQQNKKGEWKIKNEKGVVIFKYCPFCGKSTSKEEA